MLSIYHQSINQFEVDNLCFHDNMNSVGLINPFKVLKKNENLEISSRVVSLPR